jgi:hypothetical protein
MGRVVFQPVVLAEKNTDGTWRVEFDWADSLMGEEGDDQGLHPTAHAEEAVTFMDQWTDRPNAFYDIPAHLIEEDPA